ncbi:MAG: tRNA (adenosine(37)-N6)-dimethylallyltransferase MiaA [Maricaulaceae bacterium]
MKPVVMIAGPTASGKSALAIRMALRHDGEVINADSMQVYKDLRIISARPDSDDMCGIPHHLFGHVDGSVRYSVGQWQRDVVPVILDCLAREKTPILVGGTGMYFKSLTDGLADIPDVPADVVNQLKERLSEEGFEALYNEGLANDPVATNRLQGQDPQRLLRILSVYQHTQRALSEWQDMTRPIIPKGYWRGFMLNPPRQALYRTINKRFVQMIEEGGRDEVESLLYRNLDPSLPVMKAIGISQSIGLNKADWVTLCQRDTRRFAKRQKTYFRKYAYDWGVFDLFGRDIEVNLGDFAHSG